MMRPAGRLAVPRAAVIGLWLALVLASAFGARALSLREGLARVEDRGRADLQLASDRLVSALLQFREVAALAADHPQVVALAAGPLRGRDAGVSLVLQRIADRAGAQEIWLVTPGGRVLAGPEGGPVSLEMTGALGTAVQGTTGFAHRVLAGSGIRVFSFAVPVFGPGGPVVGVLLLRLTAEKVEAEGRGNPVPVWFTDRWGVSFLANRAEMVFEIESRDLRVPDTLYPGVTLRQRWFGDGGAGIEISRDLPVIGFTGHALADASGARRAALQAGLAVGGAMLGFGAVVFALTERRRTLARVNAALECRVAERTAELERAQADLVQAGKLSALGQMSAGISHELNQPLMAIRSYAENAELLLDRGRAAEAAENLSKISEMARRMGRIIKNLRAFARAEAEPAARVGLAAVVEGALEMMAGRIARAGVCVDWERPASPAIVMGGEVRLGQVVVNLISNALEAMEGLPEGAPRRLTLRISSAVPGRIALTIRDSGPGILDPDRIFDPFYSTKEVGTEEGLGLGLSISYGLVQGFGGTLTGGNAPGGGALFTVDLRAAERPGGRAMSDVEEGA